jgi:hypothetical protein
MIVWFKVEKCNLPFSLLFPSICEIILLALEAFLS